MALLPFQISCTSPSSWFINDALRSKHTHQSTVTKRFSTAQVPRQYTGASLTTKQHTGKLNLIYNVGLLGRFLDVVVVNPPAAAEDGEKDVPSGTEPASIPGLDGRQVRRVNNKIVSDAAADFVVSAQSVVVAHQVESKQNYGSESAPHGADHRHAFVVPAADSHCGWRDVCSQTLDLIQ